MNNNSQSDIPTFASCEETEQLEPVAAVIGVDWGEDQHAWCLRQSDGQVERGDLLHESCALHNWLSQLQERFNSQVVAFAIEAQFPPLLAALLEYPWARIYVIHPAASARFRKTFYPSGAKDDHPDADTLCELLSCHRHKLRPLEPMDCQETRLLDGFSRQRRDLVNQRNKAALQLRSALQAYYPQALDMLNGNLTSHMALVLFLPHQTGCNQYPVLPEYLKS